MQINNILHSTVSRFFRLLEYHIRKVRPFCGFFVAFVTSLAIKTAMEEKASAAIIKTIMEDAPIETQLL